MGLNLDAQGHTFIDILKVDIEGAEFATLSSMIKYYKEHKLPLPFGQLQLEIHADKMSFADFLKWWEDLEEAGLRAFHTEVSIHVSWLNRSKNDTSPTCYISIGTAAQHPVSLLLALISHWLT